MPISYYTPPKEQAVVQLMELTKNSVEGASYLAEQLAGKRVEEKAQPFFEKLVAHIANFAKEVSMRCGINSSGSWSGKNTDITPFTNLHSNLADEAADKLHASQKEERQALTETELDVLKTGASNAPAAEATEDRVHALDYSVDEEGQFVRGWK